jgi:hypothetical protein
MLIEMPEVKILTSFTTVESSRKERRRKKYKREWTVLFADKGSEKKKDT